MVLSFSGDDRDEVESYASGPRASIFKPDGSGFIYYPSGRVAVCKGIIDSRGRYYLYGDDPRSTPLGAVNEHAVGFFLGQGGIRLGLNKVGGFLTNKNGYIAKEWRYDLGAHMPPPNDAIGIKLNKSISFEFHDRGDMRIKFLHEGISHELDAGVRPKREGSYLDHSIRLPGGRLEPQLDRISLVSRQLSFGNAMKAKRDRLKPRSRDLAGACKALVAGLENGFDGMGPKVEPFPDPSWKNDARATTSCELPRIRRTGLEVGPTHGLGDTIYGDNDGGSGEDCLNRSSSWSGGGSTTTFGRGRDCDAFAPAARLRKNGKWLGELDVRRRVFQENPLLKRSNMLQAASGRYGEEIVVPGGKVSATNPTGKVTVTGAPLRKVPALRLQAFLEEEVGHDQLVVVVCVRGDSPACSKVESVAELTNHFLLQLTSGAGRSSTPRAAWTATASSSGVGSTRASSSSSTEKFQIVKVDFSENQGTADKYGVKSLPAFLMFQAGRLAWTGTLGGKPVKAAPPRDAAAQGRILLVEPVARAQISTERTMRKFGCGWDLVLNASQALSRIQIARTDAMSSQPATEDGGGGYRVLMISDALGASETMAIEKAFRSGGGQGGKNDSLIVGLATVKGDALYLPEDALEVVSAGFTETGPGKRAVLSPHLALVADVAATKPLKASALKAVFMCCARRDGDESTRGKSDGLKTSIPTSCTLEGGDRRYKGVTPSRLLDKMETARAQAALGIFEANRASELGRKLRPGGSSIGRAEILVSAQETSYRGYNLEKSTLQHILNSGVE